MDPLSIVPQPARITQQLHDQLQDLGRADAQHIETLHRATPLDANPAFQLAAHALADTGRENDWDEARTVIWDVVEERGLSQRVRYAAYDAALALLTRDVLDGATFASLYGPWAGGCDEHVLSLAPA